jgi:hypothetical protein
MDLVKQIRALARPPQAEFTDLGRLVLERARTAAEAVAVLTELVGPRGSPARSPRTAARHPPRTSFTSIFGRPLSPKCQYNAAGPQVGLYGQTCKTCPQASHGRRCHFDAPHHISLALLRTKDNEGRLDGSWKNNPWPPQAADYNSLFMVSDTTAVYSVMAVGHEWGRRSRGRHRHSAPPLT